MARADRQTPEEEPNGRREGSPRDRAEAVNRQRAMQKKLREMFDKIVDEPLPDDMSRLLDEIGRGEGPDPDAAKRTPDQDPKDGSARKDGPK